MGTKKAIRGFADLSIFPVTKNDSTEYTVGERVLIAGAQELTSDPETEEWKIFADDGLYDTGSDWKGNKFTLTLAGLPLELRPHFEGGEYDETKKEYTFASDSEAPEIAMTFSSISGKGAKELTRVYSAKCSKVSMEHKTKGDGNSVTPVKIEGTFMSRKTDGSIFTKKDATETDISWIETMGTTTP